MCGYVLLYVFAWIFMFGGAAKRLELAPEKDACGGFKTECMCVRTYVRAHVRTYIRTHVRTYVRTYVRS